MLISSVLFLVVWTSSSFAEESSSSDAASVKRTPMGFQSMHGNKNLIPTVAEHNEVSKRTLVDFQDKDLSAPDIEDNLLHDEFDKRAPMGFQGMRGKKDYLIPDFEDSYFREDYEKRAPMGFQGMRGKKILEDDYYKRAPMGFQGMRGKKSLEEVLNEIEKRKAMGFYGTRGKKTYVFEYPQDYEKRLLATGFQGMHDKMKEFPADWEKRAPMGFQGMRGKKALLDEIEELEKRALMGFQGMRGKKDNFENYVDYTDSDMDFDKRAPMGFQGMRGKKDTDKRALMGFQGMRGKRSIGQRFGTDMDFGTRSLHEYQGMGDRRHSLASCQVEKRSPFRYFEMRGKKNPRWELRGMFVGVRGKKWAKAPYEDNSPFIRLFDNIERIGVDGDSPATLDSQ
ncbi:tachykinins isoform X2 [Monomorium pharaonis]|uniref:tachykinins isoform X2 n=1 Tax=Monomorium pharaonis TaxID=307658 RepID=UPI00063F65A9|nr:tachykinins isoform X2 [Monomorium pharaonis]